MSQENQTVTASADEHPQRERRQTKFFIDQYAELLIPFLSKEKQAYFKPKKANRKPRVNKAAEEKKAQKAKEKAARDAAKHKRRRTSGAHQPA